MDFRFAHYNQHVDILDDNLQERIVVPHQILYVEKEFLWSTACKLYIFLQSKRIPELQQYSEGGNVWRSMALKELV